jgi:hypothetical protein
MENKLETVWSTELDECMEERFGISIDEIMRDEILKAIRDEIKKTRRNRNEHQETDKNH